MRKFFFFVVTIPVALGGEELLALAQQTKFKKQAATKNETSYRHATTTTTTLTDEGSLLSTTTKKKPQQQQKKKQKKRGSDPHLAMLYERQPLVRRVMDANDNLRAMGLGSQFDFPSIVVLGDQSAGKSSVLEAISGVQLLRGAGIVTKAPIELRLDGAGGENKGDCVAVVEGTPTSGERKRGGHHHHHETRGERPSVPCSAIGSEINATMAELLRGGGNKHIAETPIRVRVTSAGLPDLTLVDLPGLARVAVQGQSADVPALTRALAAKYVSSENALILAVVPANADLATAEALRVAAEADPEGKRTVGVLTKPDLMDPGTESSLQEILDGDVVPLKTHGYFVVRNRGQRDIDRAVDLDDALRDEAAFFRDHPVFGPMARSWSGGGVEGGQGGEKSKGENRFGVPTLVRYLTDVLVRRVVDEVPKMRRKVEARVIEERRTLATLGGAAPAEKLATAADRKAYLLELTTGFAMAVRETTRGYYELLSRDSADRAFMSDLLRRYKTFYLDVCRAAPDVNSTSYDAAVRSAVQSQHGREAFYGFPSYAIFSDLVRDLVLKIFAPADACANDVRNRVVQMARSNSADLFARRFPKLRRALDDVAKHLADERHLDTKQALDIFLNMQMQPFTQALLKVHHDDDDWRTSATSATTSSASSEEEEEEDADATTTAASSSFEEASSSARGTSSSSSSPHPSSPENNNDDDPAAWFFGRGSSTGETFRPQQSLKAAMRQRYFQESPPPPQHRQKKPQQLDANADAVDFVKAKIHRYFGILAQRVGDLVPMAIDMYLVQRFGHDLAFRVTNATQARSDREIKELLRENSDLARRRTDVQHMLTKLTTAREVLDDFSACGTDSLFLSTDDDDETDDDETDDDDYFDDRNLVALVD